MQKDPNTGNLIRRKAEPRIDPAKAAALFREAGDDALVDEHVASVVLSVPVQSLSKARCLGDEALPPFVRVGTRVRYRVGTLRAYLRALEERRAS